MKSITISFRGLLTAVTLGVLCGAVHAGTFTLSVNTDLGTPQVVGRPVAVEPSVSGADPAELVFRYDYFTPEDGQWHLLQDFSPRTRFDWVTLEGGTYVLRVTARNPVTGEFQVAAKPFGRISPSFVTGTSLVLPTANPLVLLFSAPPCPPGAALRVNFWLDAGGANVAQSTHLKDCRSGRGVNHFIAGLRPQTRYSMQYEIVAGTSSSLGAILTATTGVPPGYVVDFQIVDTPDEQTSFAQDVFAWGYISPQIDDNWIRASDLRGNLIWTWGRGQPAGTRGRLLRPVPGGTFLLSIDETDLQQQQIREIDLAGNTVRATFVEEINRQLVAMGAGDVIGAFHHEARYLPNGHLAVLGSVERILTDVQGPGDVNVYGESVVVLDQNWQVAWFWNAFDHMDPSEMAILGETCAQGQAGCPPLFLDDEATDWLHMNSIAHSPDDGALILSARHHDAVYKINYDNGNGDGSVIWRLGEGGDFTAVAPGVTWPWFSHQHDAHYDDGVLMIYDNGNTRRDALGDQENSRGQVWLLDETNMTATLQHNIDLGHYAAAVGAADRLEGRNFSFHSGFLGTGAEPAFTTTEYTPFNTPTWAIGGVGRSYRGFRMNSLYAP